MQDVLSYQSSRPELSMELQSKVADTLVNPNWDPWSESTKRLEETVETDKKVNNILSWVELSGLGFDIKSAHDFYKVFSGASPFSKLGILSIFATLIVFGTKELNEVEEEKLERELKNRTAKAKTSVYYH